MYYNSVHSDISVVITCVKTIIGVKTLKHVLKKNISVLNFIAI